uniref:Uncharacterized protein n=1 Tax=Sipha flava TaxID=143950 RepID=A0A2S2R0I3_9HEMI
MVFGSGNKFRIKRSQSKASYLSAYKREPREREKGLPNFEGSYKRTASPNNTGRSDAAVAEEPQDVENVAPDGSDCSGNLLELGGRLQQDNNNSTTTSQQPSPVKQQPVDVTTAAVVTLPPAPTVLSERPIVDQQQQQQPQPQQPQQQSKTLPRSNNSAGQDFKRSSRTPRTQSDPSNMPNKTDAAVITTLQMMMMPPPRHSESVSSLHTQKRSQSDLSQVGSTESGYSSLSLNAPSPSHSPTRMSSSDFGTAIGAPPLHHHHSSTAAIITAVGGELADECTSSWHPAEQIAAATSPAAPVNQQYHHPVSRSCSVVSSDAASQTDLKSGAGTPSVVRRKLPEEIECEELSRDLISHLSPSDKLHNILGESSQRVRVLVTPTPGHKCESCAT